MIMIKVDWFNDDYKKNDDNDKNDDDDDDDDDDTHLWERLVLRGERFTQSRLVSPQTNFNKHDHLDDIKDFDCDIDNDEDPDHDWWSW